MSELSENWKNLKRDIGAFTGKINSLVDRYEPLADVDEKAYRRGYDKGYQEAMAKTKADICNGCQHKKLADSVRDYENLLSTYKNLPSFKQECVLRLVSLLLGTNDIEKMAKKIKRGCSLCAGDYDAKYCLKHTCDEGIAEWLKKEHIEPMPTLKVGDVLDVTLEDGAWYDGICVAKGIVYVMSECICKEITEVKINAISRWSSGGMKEVWRAEDE